MRTFSPHKKTLCFIAAETAAALIGAGTSVASAGGSMFTAKKNREYQSKENEKARAWSESMMEKQRQQELEDRTHEESYNSPAAQRARMLAAGLAVEGVTSQIASNSVAAEAESNTPFSPADYAPNGIGEYVNPIESGIGGLTQLANLANIRANTANTEADTDNKNALLDKIKAETDSIKANTHFTELNSKSQEIINTYLDDLQQLAIDKTKQDIQYTESQIENIQAGTEKIKKYMDEMFPAELKKTIAETGLLSQKSLSEQKNREQIDKFMEKMDAEIALICEQTGLSRLDIANYATNHMQSGFMGTGVSLVNAVKGLGVSVIGNAVTNMKNNGNALTGALTGEHGRKALSKTTKNLHKVDEVKYTSDGRMYYPYRKKKK